jgi:hypothetical protein
VIAAASNRASDAANVSKMSGPFANRQLFLNCLPPTLDGFVAFCHKHNVNPWIPAYAQHTGGEMIYEFDAKKFLLEPAFSTPRAWATDVATILDGVNLLDPDDRISLIAGKVGRARGDDFENFYRYNTELPNMEEVKATGSGIIPKSLAVKILTINSLVRHADFNCIGNIFKYVSKLGSGDPEYFDLFEKGLFTKDPTFAGHPEYTRWVIANSRKPITNAANVTSAPTPPAPLPTPTTPQPLNLRKVRI